MKHMVLWKGNLIERTVFKDRMFKKPFENPMEGEEGYIVLEYKERVLVYNSKYQVWHDRGVRVDTFRELLVPRHAGHVK